MSEYIEHTVATVEVDAYALHIIERVTEEGKFGSREYKSELRHTSGMVDQDFWEDPLEMIEHAQIATGQNDTEYQLMASMMTQADLYWKNRAAAIKAQRQQRQALKGMSV